MNIQHLFNKLSFSLIFLTVVFLNIPSTVFCQTEKLGIVQYAPPKGMTKTPQSNVVAFSEFNQTTGTYCLITLYGATSGTGNPTSDFTREWKNLVVKNMKAEANPTTDTQTGDGWTAISGGGAVESEAGKAVGFLTVISGFGQTVSILAIFNDPAYVKQVDSFISSLEMDKVTTPAITTTASNTTSNSEPTFDSEGNLIIPQPTRQLTTNDLAGVWIDGPNRITTEYVYSGSGKSAGRDTTASEVQTTFKSDGTYRSFFNSVRKNEMESDSKTGPYSINGRLLSIQGTGYSENSITTTKWVIRGWLELPSMTVLQLAGPWTDNAEIPEVNFTDFTSFESKYLRVTRWIRLK